MDQKVVGLGAAVAIGLAVVGISLTPVQAQGKGIVSSASGAGQITVGDDLRTFSYTAQRDSSNTTRGQAQLINRNSGNRFHMTINCLSVAGNVATMSGVVTNSTADGTPFGEGNPVWFQVVDNGEGKNAPPDLISLVVFFFGPPGVPCTSPVIPANIPVEGGNIQVR